MLNRKSIYIYVLLAAMLRLYIEWSLQLCCEQLHYNAYLNRECARTGMAPEKALTTTMWRFALLTIHINIHKESEFICLRPPSKRRVHPIMVLHLELLQFIDDVAAIYAIFIVAPRSERIYALLGQTNSHIIAAHVAIVCINRRHFVSS